MRRDRVKLSVGAILLGAAIYFFIDLATLPALLVPILIHELGHLSAMRALGLTPQALRIQMNGLRLEYAGYTSRAGVIVAALAGPAAGLAYALAASYLGKRFDNEYLLLSSGVSLLLTAFNLLPVLPLDGGRIFYALSCCALRAERADRLSDLVGFTVSAALFALGAFLMWRGYGSGLEIAAIWLLMAQTGLVKKEKVL